MDRKTFSVLRIPGFELTLERTFEMGATLEKPKALFFLIGGFFIDIFSCFFLTIADVTSFLGFFR